MDWKATLADVMAERRRELGERPSMEELVALRTGELPDEERERLIEYASWDPDVARELFDLQRFPELAGGAAGTTGGPDQDRRWWQRLRAQLQEEGILPPAAPALAPEAEPSPARWPFRLSWLPLAAAFAAGALLALLIGELHSSVQINLPVIELVAQAGDAMDVRRGGRPTVVPAGASGVVLTFAAPDLTTESGPYDLDIRRGAQEVARSKGLVPGTGGVFVVVLPRNQIGRAHV